MRDINSNRSYHTQNPDEQIIYSYFLELVRTKPPYQALEEFKTLLCDGSNYNEPKIWMALKNLALSKNANEEFKHVLYRSCHIFINHWELTRISSTMMKELFHILLFARPYGQHRSHVIKKIEELLNLFVKSDQFIKLKRLSQVIQSETESDNTTGSLQPSIGKLIKRYPYLYEHCLISEDCYTEYQQTIKQIQQEKQQKFEKELSRYIIYQVRRGNTPIDSQKMLSVPSPTLLSDRELAAALKIFLGKVDGQYTQKELADQFLKQVKELHSLKEFKDELSGYLIKAISSEKYRLNFERRLQSYLKTILAQSETQEPNEFLIVRTCSQLLNFLIVESSTTPNHLVFLDLLTNLGEARTVALLLKIVLVCRKVKPYLERRFAILYSLYETKAQEELPWLIKSMESLNVALTVYFGAIDLSILKDRLK